MLVHLLCAQKHAVISDLSNKFKGRHATSLANIPLVSLQKINILKIYEI
jgi:hypothetical protein